MPATIIGGGSCYGVIVRAGSTSEGTSFGRAPQSMEWA